MLVQPVLVQVLYQFPPELHVEVCLVVVLLPLVCDCDLVRNADSLEIPYELAEVDASCHEVTLHVQAPYILGLRVSMHPAETCVHSICLQDKSIGVVPHSNAVFGVMDH